MNIYTYIKKNYRKLFTRYGVVFLNQSKKLSKYEIGEWTYVFIDVMDWNQSTTFNVGRFCSFADNLVVLLGGDHRTDFITTYPFYSFLPKAKMFSGFSLFRSWIKLPILTKIRTILGTLRKLIRRGL